jgi:hypothetical protein
MKSAPATFDMTPICDLLVRIHPADTANRVSADTDIGVETVKTWLKRRNEMRLRHFCRLVQVYGPVVLDALKLREAREP